MVSDAAFAQLQAQVTVLSRQLNLKVLGNDPSTNLGLSSQAINFGGPVQAGSLALQLNGVETSINNSTDPDLGETVSMESRDVTITHGDKLAIAPNALLILAWDGAAYQVIASISDNSSGAGNVTLTANGTTHSISLDASNPEILITDGVNSSALLPNGIIVNNGVGINAGPVVLGAHTLTFNKGILTNLV